MATPQKTIGLVLSDRVLAGLFVDHKLQGSIHSFPPTDDDHGLVELHTDALVSALCNEIRVLAAGHDDIAAIGLSMPGLIKNGVVEDSPNIPQLKGAHIRALLERELATLGLHAPICVLNDADGTAAGYAAHSGRLDQFIRVWTFGVGIGYGRYPFREGQGEGGHTVVTLDDRERFCGCGGKGHLEGIMGHRAMRLRFLDMEPDEVFAAAKSDKTDNGPDHERCLQFKRLWHRALAAGVANSVHLEGPGKFFLTGFNHHFIELPLVKEYLAEMVKMSPLQSYTLEVVPVDAEINVLGAAVAAGHAAAQGC